MEFRYLTQHKDYKIQAPTSNFQDEGKDIEAGFGLCKYPVQFLGSPVSVDGVFFIESRFSLEAALKKASPSYKASKTARISATNKMRRAAAKSKKPTSVEQLQELVRSWLKEVLINANGYFSAQRKLLRRHRPAEAQ